MRRKFLYYKFLLLTFITIFTFDSLATKIVAVVGKSVITDYELSQKVKIFAFLQGKTIANNEELQATEQIFLPLLIEEQIKKNYAEALGLEVPDTFIQGILDSISKERNFKSANSLQKHLQKLGIDWTMFKETIKEQIIWNNILQNGIIPNLNITEDEVNQRIVIKHNNSQDKDLKETVRNEILQEKAALNVKKIITQLKKIQIIETMQ